MAKALKIIGVIALVAGIIWFIVLFTQTSEFWISVSTLIYAIPGFALFYGVGQILENTEELISMKKQESLSQSKPFYMQEKTKYKKCPECGELNSEYSGGCSSCGASLVQAKVVER